MGGLCASIKQGNQMREANLALCFQIQNFLVTKLIEMMKGLMLMNGLNRVGLG